MNKNNAYLSEDGPEDTNAYPLMVRHSAQRVIAKAQMQAKTTDRVLGPKYVFVCRLPLNAAPHNLRIEDFKSGNQK